MLHRKIEAGFLGFLFFFLFNESALGYQVKIGGITKNFSYRRTLTIPGSQVQGGPHSSYPMLFDSTQPGGTGLPDDLKTTVNGGKVQNARGYDIVLAPGDGEEILKHEIDEYIPSTGEYIAWVKIDLTGSNQTIYLYYGSGEVDSNTQQVTEVWSNGYEAVYHLNDPNDPNEPFTDSTSNGHDGTNYRTTDTTGKIAQARNFSPTWSPLEVDYIDIGTWSVSGDDITIQAWINPDDFLQNDPRVVAKAKNNNIAVESHVWMLSLYNGDSDDNLLRLRIKTGTADNIGTSTLIGTSPNGYLPAAGSWYLVAATYDGALMALASDGLDAGSDSKTGNLRENRWNINIGNNPGYVVPNQASWRGKIDEVRISSTVRSTDWLKTEYNNQSSPDTFYSVGEATLVLLLSLKATVLDNGVLLKWQTASEIDNTGFHIWRSDTKDGEYVRITAYRIPARGDLTEGASYMHEDTDVRLGRNYWYKLEDIDITGNSTFHGPVFVQIPAGWNVPEVSTVRSGTNVVSTGYTVLSLFLLPAAMILLWRKWQRNHGLTRGKCGLSSLGFMRFENLKECDSLKKKVQFSTAKVRSR